MPAQFAQDFGEAGNTLSTSEPEKLLEGSARPDLYPVDRVDHISAVTESQALCLNSNHSSPASSDAKAQAQPTD